MKSFVYYGFNGLSFIYRVPIILCVRHEQATADKIVINKTKATTLMKLIFQPFFF